MTGMVSWLALDVWENGFRNWDIGFCAAHESETTDVSSKTPSQKPMEIPLVRKLTL